MLKIIAIALATVVAGNAGAEAPARPDPAAERELDLSAALAA